VPEQKSFPGDAEMNAELMHWRLFPGVCSRWRKRQRERLGCQQWRVWPATLLSFWTLWYFNLMKMKFENISQINKLINSWNFTVRCEQSASSPTPVHCTLCLRYLLTYVGWSALHITTPWQNRINRP